MRIGLVALLLIMVYSSSAAEDSPWRQEIDHLLSFIEQSDCTFIRNGKSYTAVEARQHIEKKYTYLKKRISSTQQFIAYTASKSSITGKKYTVTCDADTLPSRQWLEAELNRFRSSNEIADTTGEGK